MKTCTYCGRENDNALAVRRECGTEFRPVEWASRATELPQRGRVILWIGAILVMGIPFVANPLLVIIVPAFAVFYLPIYLPFLLSFAMKEQEWRELRWCLRIGSVLAFFIRLYGISRRPEFGDDMSGNIAGDINNIAWTWGSGLACAFAALIVGLLLRATLRSRLTGPCEACCTKPRVSEGHHC